jgi:hypothetical protein
MTGKEHGNGWLWPSQDRPYITLHHTLAVMSICDNGKNKKSPAFRFLKSPGESIYGGKYTKDRCSSFVFPLSGHVIFAI